MVIDFKAIKFLNKTEPKRVQTSGFSVTEMLIVLAVISILTAISLPYLFQHRKLYKSEEQSLKVMDLMRETNQLALTRRRTFRFEIDLTTNEVLIIDENEAGAGDDTMIKAIPLEDTSEIRIDKKPTGVPNVNPPNYAAAKFAKDKLGHLRDGVKVKNNSVWAARFRSDGSVIDGKDNPLSSTLYVWAPLTPADPTDNTPRDKNEVRAITIFGGSGAVRYWKFSGNKFLPF